MDNQYSPDIEYTNDYYHFMSPAMIDCVALNAGTALPKTNQGFAYCDMGCGLGLTSNYLAATHPEGVFYGIDLSEPQIGRAQKFAQEVGLGNAHFLAADVMALDPSDFPDFDYIAMHGLYSWVPNTVREGVLKFIGRKLKPGGRVFVSHNVMPRWHALMPIRDFLLAEAKKSGANSVLEQAQYAMARLRVMVEKKAPFVVADHGVLDCANALLKQDPRYVAHEYLVPYLEPQSFKRVASDFAAIGLHYAGDSRETLNDYRLCIPAHLHSEIEQEKTSLERESMKDFLFATTLRRSVFVRLQPNRTPDDRNADDQFWGLTTVSVRGAPEVTFPSGQCRIDHPVYQAIMDRLQAAPRTWSDLRSSLSDVPATILRDALMILFVGQRVSPFRMNSKNATCAAFNAHQLDSSGRQALLLSSSYGGAAPADDVERLYLHARRRGLKDARAIANAMHREAVRRDWYRESPLLSTFGSTSTTQLSNQEFAVSKLLRQEDCFRAMGWIEAGT